MNLEASHLDTWTLDLLQRAAHFLSDKNAAAYLVGGSVRNLLLHEPCIDWDMTIEGDAPRLARKLANKLGGYYAHLHEKASRIVVKHEGQEAIIDVAPLQGDTIEADLLLRDFTINAIAVPLASVVQHIADGTTLALIDPTHGAADIEARRLRAVDDDVFRRDPLRMLRAVRFIMRYHLTLADQTEQMLTCNAALITRSAPERIHDELYAILGPEGATRRLRFLDEHGLLTALIPEFIPARGMPQPGLHHWDVLEHSLETVAALEQLAAVLQQEPEEIERSRFEHDGNLAELRTLLYEAQRQHIFQFAALTSPAMKLAALLHDIGKAVTYKVDNEGNIHFYGHPQAGVPLAQQIMQRLSASTHDRRLVQQVAVHHMRTGQLSRDTVTERAIRRYFVDLGPTGLNVALVSLADHLAMRGPEQLSIWWQRHLATVRLLFTRYIRERSRILPPRLVQPEELMRRLNIEPGPIIGQLLEDIAEAQAEGRVHSKDEAIWLAEERLQRM
jgi:poly(A) polymerase